MAIARAVMNPSAPHALRAQFVVRLRNGGTADLSVVRDMPAGPQRKTAAAQQLQATSDTAAPAALERLQDELRRVDPEATVAGGERLWLDNTQVATVTVDADRLQSQTGESAATFFTRQGADLLDETALPGHGPSNAARDGRAGLATTLPIVAAERRAPGVAAPDVSRQWFDGPLGIESAHAAGLDGAGVTIAIVDSGVDAQHPQLAPALTRGGGAVVDPWRDDATVPAGMGSGHGTFVAGLAVGASIGVAPGASLISSRTYGASFGDAPDATDPQRIAQRVNAVRALQNALAPGATQPAAQTSW